MAQYSVQEPESILYDIRDMKSDDLEGVLRIEQSSFLTPWTEAMFREEFSFPLCFNRVAVLKSDIIGYSCFALVWEELHLRNIAVAESCRHRGVASALLSDMMTIALERGAYLATLEVRSSNSEAAGLYDRFGFKVRGVRRCYYTDTGEDALIMWTDLREFLNVRLSEKKV